MLSLFFRLSISILALALGGCGLFPKTVKVGSKNTTAQMVIGEITAQHLEAKSFKVLRRIGMGNTALVHQATLSRDLDIYPEDTGTAIAAMLKENPIQDQQAQLERVRNEYDRLFGLRVTPPLGAVNGPVAVVLESLGAKHNLTGLRSAVESRVQWRIGVTEEFSSRMDGLSAFSSSYRMQQKEAVRTMEPLALYQALQDGQLDMVIGNEADGQLGLPNIRVLTDDNKVFAPGPVCLLARRDTLEGAPGLENALNQLSGKLSTAALRTMGKQVEIDKRPLEDVAREFLKKAGLQ
jgi:glycine betaine/choline ABC-type transport system substrate-binding protein